MPKAAKAGLGRSHGDELVQRTLDGSVQRRSQSSKGRYESKMWREAGLEEPGANLNAGAAAVVAETEVDNLEAGGFFARFGRRANWPPPNSHPSTHRRDAPGDAIDRGHMEIKNIGLFSINYFCKKSH